MSSSPAGSFEHLSPEEKRELLIRLLRQRSAASDTPYPLSHGQQALWHLHSLAPESAAYNDAWLWRVRAGLDGALLRDSFQELIDRHPSLRTTYENTPEGPRQRVHSRVPLALDVIDAVNWSPQRLNETLGFEARRLFDLDRGPVARIVLFRLGRGEQVLLTVAHHIAIDLWSLMMMMDELQAIYTARVANTSAALSQPAATYRDFVNWQTEYLAGPDGQADAEYWRRALAGEPPPLELPTDRPRPPMQSYRGACLTFEHNEDLTARLMALARSEGTTLYAVLLAGFQTTLHRYTGQSDLIVGSIASGRSRPEFQHVVGYFANMLPLRANFTGPPTFRAFLHQVKATLIGALSHQNYPFARMVQEFLPRRDPSRGPLCDVTLLLQQPTRSGGAATEHFEAFSPDDRVARMGLGGGAIELMPLEQPVAKTDMDVLMYRSGGRVAGWAYYSTDLFDSDSVRRLISHWQTLMKAAATDPDRLLIDLPIMEESERQILLQRARCTSPDPRPEVLHDLFTRQAATTPAAAAIQFGDQTLTYAELESLSDSIAARLLHSGVNRGSLVGIAVERSPLLVAAILGVLKSGAAYLPLDTSYPLQRLLFMLTDAKIEALVAHSPFAEKLSGTRLTIIDPANIDDRPSLPHVRVAPQDLAYVIYTSGSTGRPKGVMVSHGAAAGYVQWAAHNYGRGGPVHAGLYTPLTFDLTITSLFAPLISGGTLRIAPPELELDELARWLRQAPNGSLVKMTPAHLQTTLALGGEETLGRPDCVILGGEQLTWELVARLLRSHPDSRPINEYGPTEAAVGCCVYEATKFEGQTGVVPIGQPVPGARLYVLDRAMRPVPVGVPGELYIGGPCLADGYLGRAALTADRFRPDPFERPGGGRLYRSGDRVRLRSDGNFEFLGRIDDQVKIRGYRIEPGEIEAVLAEHPRIREVAVVTTGDRRETQQLAAFFVPVKSTEPGQHAIGDLDLRDYLHARLPAYMVPTAWVELDHLPRSPNGKIDRRALPQPGFTPEAEFVAPRGPLEEVLAGIIAEVLGRERIGVYDNFFALGGHSLLAGQAVARIRDALQVEVPLRLVFEKPTIAGLADALTRDPAERHRLEQASQLLLQIAQLSDEEAEQRLIDDSSNP